jgi:hypothetical protein
MEGNLPNNNNTIALDSSIKELECVNNEQGQIMLQTINHILKKINQEHVLYRTFAEPAKLWAEIVPTTNCSLTPANNNLALIFS